MSEVRCSVLGLGLRCALGEDPFVVLARLDAGESAVALQPHLWPLSEGRAAVAPDPGLRPWLRHPKEAKLFARPAALALPAAGEALRAWPGERLDLGLYLGVGAEPPDSGDSEQAIIASERDGRLDEERLATLGRALYPPLLPLRTLPNMALAHLSIQLGIGGSNGAWTGRAEAGLQAVRAAMFAIAEGRCPAALAGGTDSLVELACARDLRRLDYFGPPGEAAAILLLAPPAHPAALVQLCLETASSQEAPAIAHREALGACGAADGALALVMAVARVARGGEEVGLAVGGGQRLRVEGARPFSGG